MFIRSSTSYGQSKSIYCVFRRLHPSPVFLVFFFFFFVPSESSSTLQSRGQRCGSFCVLLIFFVTSSESVSIPQWESTMRTSWCFGVLVISRGARRIGFDSDTGRCRCELCGVGAQRIELDPKGRERTMRAVMDDVSVSFDAQRIDLDPRDWGMMMRAVGGCLSVPTDLSQFLELE